MEKQFERKDYTNFFDLMEGFSLKQNEQKMRGFNDFNILSIVRGKYEEVGLHSQFIYALLDKDEKHYQNELFLKLFIKYVLKIDANEFGKVLNVAREDLTINLIEADKRRIDFTIESENYFIGIEMKLYAEDQKNQLSDYQKELELRNSKSNNPKKIKIYYLTLNGKEASNNSHNGIEYEKVSFKKEMLDWIIACRNEVSNITNLNILLSQYQDIILQITKQYKGKVVELLEFLKQIDSSEEQEKVVQILENITKVYPKMKKEKLERFFSEELSHLLNQKLQESGWNVSFGGDKDKISEKYKVHIKFTKSSDWKIVYWLRFEENNLGNMYWAIAKLDEKIDFNHLRTNYNSFENIKNELNAKKSEWSFLWKHSSYNMSEHINILNESYEEYVENIISEFKKVIDKVDLEYLNKVTRD